MRGKVHIHGPDSQPSHHGYNKTTHNFDHVTDHVTDSYNLPVNSSTFWKSPYTGEGNISAVLRTKPIIRPNLNLASVNGHSENIQQYVDISPRLTVKSILKHKRGEDSEEHSPREEFKTRTKLEHGPNLITTGTGKGRPHGIPARSRTAGTSKRVQFSSKGQSVTQDRGTSMLNGLSPNPYQGRRLYLDRATSNRILGDPNRSVARSQVHNKTTNGHITLNGAEANIKSQIQSFIKKLRIAESEKVSMFDSGLLPRQETKAQHKTAAKLRLKKSQSYSGVTLFQDWSEFDLEKAKAKSDIDEDPPTALKSTNENSLCNVYDSKSRITLSDTVSLESFSTIHDDSVYERSPGGAKIFRPKPNASLYTKYRHITTNDVNKYGIDYTETRDSNSKNFCDKRKTNQILGWLDGVRNAQANAETSIKPPLDV